MKKNIFGFKEFDIDIYKLRSANFYKNMISQRNQMYLKLSKYLINKNSCSCILCHSKKKKIFLKWKNYNLLSCLGCSAVYPNINLKNLNQNIFMQICLKEKSISKK